MKSDSEFLKSIVGLGSRQWVLRRMPAAKNHRSASGWEVRNGKTVLGKSECLNDAAWDNAAITIRNSAK